MSLEDNGSMEHLDGKESRNTNAANPADTGSGSSPTSTALLAGYLTEPDAAAELALMARTLRKYRDQGTGPAYVVIGRKVFYPRAALLDWINSKIVMPVRERKPVRRRAA
jgi:Helix-turn-helix domain